MYFINIANVPGFGRLIDGIQRKKFRESLVIAVVVAILICFAIWYARTHVLDDSPRGSVCKYIFVVEFEVVD